jgi:hypothetical protein
MRTGGEKRLRKEKSEERARPLEAPFVPLGKRGKRAVPLQIPWSACRGKCVWYRWI